MILAGCIVLVLIFGALYAFIIKGLSTLRRSQVLAQKAKRAYRHREPSLMFTDWMRYQQAMIEAEDPAYVTMGHKFRSTYMVDPLTGSYGATTLREVKARIATSTAEEPF